MRHSMRCRCSEGVLVGVGLCACLCENKEFKANWKQQCSDCSQVELSNQVGFRAKESVAELEFNNKKVNT